MDSAGLDDINDAIERARGWFPLWLFRVEPEQPTPAMGRAESALGGERLVVQDERAQALLRRVLWLIDGFDAANVAPSIVWLITDRIESIPGLKIERELISKINVLLEARGALCSIRVLPSPIEKALNGDDFLELFAKHARQNR